ncbi:hypothetical protein OUZ56_020569 [Daphnia magna]|uniref:Transmembrane 9 superfamily member n=1 Tax=Daphnia magna TaxID=35525 RepID=A0ABQ9ZEU0_9CRUS|nr:hypothetical protein OUZ56_020569 [Daphnia magna]
MDFSEAAVGYGTDPDDASKGEGRRGDGHDRVGLEKLIFPANSNEEYYNDTKYFAIPYCESNTDLRRRNQRLYTYPIGIDIIVHRQQSNLFG